LPSAWLTVYKRPQIIALADIPTVFDEDCIRKLAAIAKLPANADLETFGWWIGAAADMFVREAGIPTANQVRNEIAALRKAAERRHFEKAAHLLGRLSPEALAILQTADPTGTLPTPGDLQDEVLRDQACATIASLCRIGGQKVEGRRRPCGKRSRSIVLPYLNAPTASQHFPKREAERRFVCRLSIAWCKATGKKPSRTARRPTDGRDIGPFARLVRECFHLVRVKYADPVALINELSQPLVRARIASLSSNNP
jgi:hypothetical protein